MKFCPKCGSAMKSERKSGKVKFVCSSCGYVEEEPAGQTVISYPPNISSKSQKEIGSSSAVAVKITLGGVKWILNTPSSLTVVAEVWNASQTLEIKVGPNQEIKASAELNVYFPANFTVNVLQEDTNVLKVEGLILPNAVRITRTDYDENKIMPLDESNLLTFEIMGRYFTIELYLPVKGGLEAKAEVDGTEVKAEIQPTSEGSVLLIRNILFTSSTSNFTVKIFHNQILVSDVRGRLSYEGLLTISLEGGLVEKLKSRTIITTGKHVVAVPAKILCSLMMKEADTVEKVIDLAITSVVKGNIPVKLIAYSRSGELLKNAVFEATISRLNTTKIYRSGEIAYLPEDENVTIIAKAEGFTPERKTVLITKDLKEVVFRLSPTSPSLMYRIYEYLRTNLMNLIYVLAVVTFILFYHLYY